MLYYCYKHIIVTISYVSPKLLSTCENGALGTVLCRYIKRVLIIFGNESAYCMLSILWCWPGMWVVRWH